MCVGWSVAILTKAVLLPRRYIYIYRCTLRAEKCTLLQIAARATRRSGGRGGKGYETRVERCGDWGSARRSSGAREAYRIDTRRKARAEAEAAAAAPRLCCIYGWSIARFRCCGDRAQSTPGINARMLVSRAEGGEFGENIRSRFHLLELRSLCRTFEELKGRNENFLRTQIIDASFFFFFYVFLNMQSAGRENDRSIGDPRFGRKIAPKYKRSGGLKSEREGDDSKLFRGESQTATQTLVPRRHKFIGEMCVTVVFLIICDNKTTERHARSVEETMPQYIDFSITGS